MSDDLAKRFQASNDAQECARDLLKAGEHILKAGNTLFNDVNDVDAFAETVAAVLDANIALSEFLKIVRFEMPDVEA